MPSALEVSLPSGFIRAISSAFTQEQILTAAADWLPKLIVAERSSIALPIDDAHMEIYAFAGNTSVVRTAEAIPIASSAIGKTYRDREVLVVDDTRDTEYSDLVGLTEAGLYSALTAPIASGGRCLGTVNLGTRGVGSFSDAHQELLGTIGELIAGPLHLAQLAEREKARARTDDLTRSLNRRAVLAELDARLSDTDDGLSLLYIDLDGFKLINDIHGHYTGDRVLRILVDRIKAAMRPDETIGRIGGDEFLIIVNNDQSGMRARGLADQILEVCDQPVVVRQLRIDASLSIGVVSPDAAGQTIGGRAGAAVELLAEADRAMYQAKKSGRRVVVVDDEIRRRASMLTVVDQDLDEAMVERSIVFHYQPICDLATGTIIGAEALIRWQHPEYGAIPAPLLMNRIEATGRVASFTRWCVDTVARDLTTVKRVVPSFGEGRFSVNLSPLQLAMSDCADLILTTCSKHGLQPGELPVEVVESSEIRPGDQAENTLRELSEAGCMVALDDFGTGHNALGYFTRFPIHVIKFDRSLVGVITTNRAAHKILKAMASMSRDLGIMSLAEGIEQQEEMEACHDLRITYGQGWHLGRPKPIDELIAILQQASISAPVPALQS